MFFRRKKSAPATPEAAAPAAPAARAADAADAAEAAPAAANVAHSTQFLTGEAGRDRRTVQVLLEAIARVSEARDL
jgi:hypothetical protein